MQKKIILSSAPQIGAWFAIMMLQSRAHAHGIWTRDRVSPILRGEKALCAPSTLVGRCG